MAQIVDLFALFFLVVGLSYLLTRAAMKTKRVKTSDLELVDGQVLRLITPSGSYRTHLVATRSGSLLISAPLHRDRYVPLRVGEKIVVQSPGFDSLLTFHTTVTDRDSVTHELTLSPPTWFRRTDRRCEPRFLAVKGEHASLNRKPAVLQDLSAWGAKLITSERVSPGDYVAVQLPSEYGEARGYALEVRSSAWEGRSCCEVRIRFEEPLSGLVSLRGLHA